MTVKEQYVIFDAVAMVGAIGGTLGMCIGFSFSDMVSSLLGWIEEVISSKGSGGSRIDIMNGPVT